jgi:hypothetical protein
MLKLSCSYDSVRFVLVKIRTEWVINCYILCHFSIFNFFNTIVGAVGAASRYGSGSGSDQKMRLLAAPAPQHWFESFSGGSKKVKVFLLQIAYVKL